MTNIDEYIDASGNINYTAIKEHPEVKDELKPHLINLLKSFEAGKRVRQLGNVAKLYSDNDSIKELINLTDDMEDNWSLEELYEAIPRINYSKEVLHILMEKIDARGQDSQLHYAVEVVLSYLNEEDARPVAEKYLNMPPDSRAFSAMANSIAQRCPELYLNKLEELNRVGQLTSEILLIGIPVENLSKQGKMRYKNIILKNILKDLSNNDYISNNNLDTLDSLPWEFVSEDEFWQLKEHIFVHDEIDDSIYYMLAKHCPQKYIKDLFNEINEAEWIIGKDEMLQELLQKDYTDSFISELCKKKEQEFSKATQKNLCERERIERILRETNYIEKTLKAEYPELSMEEALVRAAAKARQSNNPEALNDFNAFILAEGESRLVEYDEQVIDWLADNLTDKNLQDVNALRAFYGLKLTINDNPYYNANRNAVIRSQFDGAMSLTDEYSEFYDIQYSKDFREYLENQDKYKQKYDLKTYKKILEQSEAVDWLRKYEYHNTADALPEILQKAMVPPELAVKFNVKDLQNLCITYGETDESRSRYGDRVFFDRSNIEHYDISAKKQFWQDIATHNPQVLKAVAADMLRHGIDAEDIKTFFSNAKSGNPHFRGCPAFLQVHHRKAIKDGGDNNPENFVIVIKYDDFSAHDLLHRRDTPLKSDMIIHKQTGKEVRLETEFLDDADGKNKVRFYGGLRSSSRYIGDLKNMFNVSKVEDNEKIKDIDNAVKLAFASVLRQINKLEEHKAVTILNVPKKTVKNTKKRQPKQNTNYSLGARHHGL